MKKHNIRGKVLFCIALSGCLFLNYRSVKAEEKYNDTQLVIKDSTTIKCDDAEDVEKCKANANKCVDFLKSFNANSGFDESKNNFKYNGNYLKQNGTMKVNGATINYKVDTSGSTNGETTQTKYTISSDYEYVVGDEKYPCNGIKTHTIIVYEPSNEQSYYDNPALQDDGICKKYLNGEKTNNEILDADKNKYSALNKDGSFKEYLQKYADYCFKPTVSETYSDNKIIKKIINAITTYNFDKSIKESENKPSNIIIPVGAKQIKEGTNVSLTCDAFGRKIPLGNAEERQRNFKTISIEKDTNKFVETDVNKRVFYKTETKKFKDQHGKVREGVFVQYAKKIEKVNGKDKVVEYYPEEKLCDVTCTEVVTTTYYPPITVKGGICFQYEIEVKSVTKCDTKYTGKGNPPKVEDKEPCNIVPNCSQSVSEIQYQAGPNEEFEECIAAKFNGKYTQKAINYCYNKVYKKKKKSNNKVSNDYELDDITAKKVAYAANSEYWWCDTKNFSVEKADVIAEKAYEAYTKKGNVGGTFVEKNGIIDWKNYNDNKPEDSSIKYIPGCYWNQYATFYFKTQDRAYRTVYDDQNIIGKSKDAIDKNSSLIVKNKNKTLGELRKRYYEKAGMPTEIASFSYYFPSTAGKEFENWGWHNTLGRVRMSFNNIKIPVNGLKWAYYTNAGSVCSEKCSFKKVNSSKDCTLDPTSNNNSSTKVTEYNETLYNKQKAQCSVKTACKEDKVVYKFNVQKPTSEANKDNINITVCGIDKKGDKCIQWEQNNEKKHQIKNYAGNKTSIIREVQGTCAVKGSKGEYEYWDIINFYGQPKEKGIYYYNDLKEGVKYTYEPHKMCIPKTAPEINRNWAAWDIGFDGFDEPRVADINKINGKVKYTIATDGTGTQYYRYGDKKEGKYNIFAKIQNFGYFGWNLDYSCFYSIYKNSGDNQSAAANSKTRTVTLDNLFPSSGNMSNTTEEVTAKKLSGTDSEITATKIDDTTVIEKNGRKPGYNWSDKAIDESREHYKINPIQLVDKIKSLGYDKVYENSKELDYRLVLTVNNIKQIKAYNKKHEFVDFPEITHDSAKDTAYKKIDDIYFYKSKFIRNSTYVSKASGKNTSVIPEKYGCNNFTNGTC